MSSSNFLSAKFEIPAPIRLASELATPGRTENDGRQQRRRLFPSRRKLLSGGFPEIVRDSSTSLGMTKMAENEPTTVSLPPSMPVLSCRAKSRHLQLFSENFWREIVPPWVHRCDQLHFLRSRPFLELLFACDGVLHICAVFVVNQFSAAVTRCKPRNSARAMLADPMTPCSTLGMTNDLARRLIGDNVDPEVIVRWHSKIVRDSSTSLGMTRGR